MKELRAICPKALSDRYSKLTEDTPDAALLDAVCQSRGFIRKGGILDTERGAKVLLDEFRAGKIARITLEQPEAES